MLETNALDEPVLETNALDEPVLELKEPYAPVPDELHARDLTKQPGPLSVLGGLCSSVLETYANAPDEPYAPLPGAAHEPYPSDMSNAPGAHEPYTKQPSLLGVLGGLCSREVDIFLLQLDDAPDEPMTSVPKQPGLPSALGGRRGREWTSSASSSY